MGIRIEEIEEELRDKIDQMNKWLFDNVNNAVYRASFARSKEAHWDAFNAFYAALDLLEERLSKRRFLFGDYITDADVRLYVTLSRLDIRYTHQLGHTKKRLIDYPNLWGYARDLYQIPAFAHNTYFHDFAATNRNFFRESAPAHLKSSGTLKFKVKSARKNSILSRTAGAFLMINCTSSRS